MDHKLTDNQRASYVRRHLRFAWWSLLVFLSLGIVLELFHAFKIGWYLDVTNDTRRLMWTLAHAHGTLLSLIHVAFAVTVNVYTDIHARQVRRASPLFMGASILLPGGFFIGGLFFYQGDPGMGIFLVPLGAVLLFVAVWMTIRGSRKTNHSSDLSEPKDTEKIRYKGKKKRRG